MKKDKTSKKNRHISLIIAPHYPGKTKTFKLRAGVFKYITMFVTILVTVIICQTLITIHLSKKAEYLSNQVSELSDINHTQRFLLGEKIDQIEKLQANDKEINEKEHEFIDKYRKITENYITRKLTVSRSKDYERRDQDTFLKDVQELKNILASLDNITSINKEITINLTQKEKDLKKYLLSLPTFWPASGRISDDFGYRMHPISFTRQFHTGIDIAAKYNTDVVAAGSGKVIFTGYNGGYGKTVIIDHGSNITTLYGHANNILVRKGQQVDQGSLIAKVGSTGNSTGPHLHFEIRVNDVPVDPLKYLDK